LGFLPSDDKLIAVADADALVLGKVDAHERGSRQQVTVGLRVRSDAMTNMPLITVTYSASAVMLFS
jgi:hypothetical protein